MLTLKSNLPILKTGMRTLAEKAGTTPRERGRSWMKKRQDVLRRDLYGCVDCGHVSELNEVDHDVPLEQGGSNEESNLKTRCPVCHAEKTAREAGARAGGGSR